MFVRFLMDFLAQNKTAKNLSADHAVNALKCHYSEYSTYIWLTAKQLNNTEYEWQRKGKTNLSKIVFWAHQIHKQDQYIILINQCAMTQALAWTNWKQNMSLH